MRKPKEKENFLSYERLRVMSYECLRVISFFVGFLIVIQSNAVRKDLGSIKRGKYKRCYLNFVVKILRIPGLRYANLCLELKK